MLEKSQKKHHIRSDAVLKDWDPQTFNQRVVGSNPTGLTNKINGLQEKKLAEDVK